MQGRPLQATRNGRHGLNMGTLNRAKGFKLFPSFFLVRYSTVFLENKLLGGSFLRVLRCSFDEDLFPTDLRRPSSLPQLTDVQMHFQPLLPEDILGSLSRVLREGPRSFLSNWWQSGHVDL